MTTRNWRIVFLDRATIGPGVRMPTPDFQHCWQDHEQTPAEQISDRIEAAQIVVTNKVPIGAAELASAAALQLIAVAATGVDVVDLEACRSRGVAVVNVRDYATNAVPELVLAAMLGLRRQLPRYRQQILDGAWQDAKQFCFFTEPAHDLAGATLGIIGTGSIATALGERGRCLGMRVLYHSLSRRSADHLPLVDLPQLLAVSDVVSCHCPLDERSRGLLDDVRIGAMKRGALLINTARGGIVDLAAVLSALDAGHLAGAALDVFDTEPPPAGGVAMQLAQRLDVIVTPHIAWASVEAMQALANQLVAIINAFVAGRPRNRLC